MDHAQILTHCLDMSAASMRIATSNQYYNRVPFQEINQSILELQIATADLEEYRRHSLDLNDSGQMSLYQLRVQTLTQWEADLTAGLQGRQQMHQQNVQQVMRHADDEDGEDDRNRRRWE
jgi:hypothetical protein